MRDWSTLGTAVFSATLASHVMARFVFGASIYESLGFEKPREDTKNPAEEPLDANTEAQVKAGMRKASEETFRKIVPAWQLVNDIVVMAWYSWVLVSGQAIPSYLWAPLACSFYLTTCCYTRQHRFAAERDTVVLSIMGFLSTINSPRHATHITSMIRLLLNSWLPSPKMALLMQFALEPGFFADSCFRESVSTGQEFMELFLSEIVLLLGLVVAHYKQQGSLYTQISASMRAETSMQENLSLGDAAKRLLTVTCDACVSLSEELRILKPPASLNHLLGSDELDGKSFLDYVSDPQRIANFINSSATYAEGTATPSSCHVQILSANGSFNAEIFHVKIYGGASTSRHFIGIAADNQQKDSVKADDTSGHDMKFLLGCNTGGQENLQRNDRESISTRFWQDLEEISSAKILVDAMAPEAGFVVKSASFEFAELLEGREKLPNLLEWVEPSCRRRVLIWVQDTVNAQYGGRSFEETLPGVKFFCPGAEGGLLLGHLHIIDLQEGEQSTKSTKESNKESESEDENDEGESDENDGGESEEEVSMQLLLEVRDLRKC